MGDTEQPASEFLVVTQHGEVTKRADKGLLHEVEARLFVAYQFEHIYIQWQSVAPEERLPRFDVAFPCFGHGQLFAFGHYQHLHPVECREREKVQSNESAGTDRKADQ